MSSFLHKIFGYQQDPQPSDEDIDLAKFYTDSEYALQVFEQLVGATELPKRLLVIHGLGGVGKSSLLKMYEYFCYMHHIPVAIVANEEAPSPIDMLANWETDLSHDSITLPVFHKTLIHYRAIQAKVEAEAKKGHHMVPQIADTLGKAAAKTAVGWALSAVPIVGPLASAIGSNSTDAFIEWLYSFLPKSDLEFYLDPSRRLDSDFLSDLSRVSVRQRIVLMIDTYEQMTTLDVWIRDLARRLPKNVLLVVAGRTVPEWERAWQGWMGKAEIIELKEMTSDDLRTLVCRYYVYIRGGDPDPQQVEAIVQFARGLPMVATTVVQLWVKYRLEDFQTVRPQVVADLVDRLLEGVPQEMRPAFEAAAVLRYFNVDALGALLEDSNAEALYAELRRWPFIRSRREGLAVHDTMREIINEALLVRTLERFRVLHERAVVYYEARLEKATGEEGEHYALERLYHKVQTAEEEGINEFRKAAEKLVNYQLLNQLRTLLNDVNNYPLRKENSQLWREYYRARLMDLEGRQVDAVPLYQTIAENSQAEKILRAYALCDWAWFVGRMDMELKERILEGVHLLFPEPDALPELDAKLGLYLLGVAEMYKEQGRLNDSLTYLERAQRLYERLDDSYWLAFTYNRIKYHYLGCGMWKEGFKMQEQGLQEMMKLKGEQQQSYLEAELLGGLATGWIWAGQFHDTEEKLKNALSITERFKRAQQRIYFLRDFALVLGLQGRVQDASKHFSECIELGKQQDPLFEAIAQRSQGIIALKWQGVDEAEQHLVASMKEFAKQPRRKYSMLQSLLAYGMLYEVKGTPKLAEQAYRECLDLRQFERWYLHAAALTGLVRVYYAVGEYDALASALRESEMLAQQYEYNDHLASLRLTQGHLAWEGQESDEGQRFVAALHYYQQALIYALRYNRFLLDEVVSGLPHGTPLQPIIPYCLKCGEEGQRMLLKLRDWWRDGLNDLGTARPDSISSIPEGISLLDGEGLARAQEPGNNSRQQMILEQLDKAC